MNDVLDDCIAKVIDGSLSPNRFDAVCRGLQMKLDAYRLGDAAMKRVRTEEIEAAAEHLDVNPNLDVLKAADIKKAEQDRYRRESLVHQGFAQFSVMSKPGEPPKVFLNEKGRRSLGYHNYEDRQFLLERMHNELLDFSADSPKIPGLPEMTAELQDFQGDIEETLSGLPHMGETPFDPLTGQAITKLPAGVLMSPCRALGNDYDEDPQEALAEQLSYVKKLQGRVKEKSEGELYKRRVEEQATGQGERAQMEAYLEARFPVKEQRE